MRQSEKTRRFEAIVIPHMAAAYNLARWLVHNGTDAEDVVQEASLRAFRFLDGFRGGDSRAWLLAIVRNTSYTWLQQNRAQELTSSFNEETHEDDQNPELAVHQMIDHQLLRKALETLSIEYREVIVLRDLEGLSYKEIAEAVSVPIGTVMSRLARGRKLLQKLFVRISNMRSD